MSKLPHRGIMMVRATLHDLPAYPILAPFALRYYQPGDVKHWLAIHSAADEQRHFDSAFFSEQFGADEAKLARRQLYLLDGNGRPIGTASAWNGYWPGGDTTKRKEGLVHWVAILPEWQGKGLGKPLLSSVCHHLYKLGHKRAILATYSERLTAVNFYLHFGFQPLIRHDRDKETWGIMQPHLKYPITI